MFSLRTVIVLPLKTYPAVSLSTIIKTSFWSFTGGVDIRIREKTSGQAAQTAAQGNGDGDTEEECALSGDAPAAQAHTQSRALGGGL